MTFVETTDTELVCKIIASEITNSGIVTQIPTAGGLSKCITAGDFCFIDTAEPRVACWCHPLTATEVVVVHLWGPSSSMEITMYNLARALVAKGYITVRWTPQNTYGQDAKEAMGNSIVVNPDRTVSISLATAVANWKTRLGL